MIEKIKYALISDIYVKDLIFYNEDKLVDLIEFCEVNGISYLPSTDRISCYRLQNNQFTKQDLTNDMICRPFDRIFERDTLLKFEKGKHDEVLFVVENDLIKGVVHIVDYNNDFINFEFYKATFQIEKMLRELLRQKGESNDSLLQWMQEKSNSKLFWKKRLDQCIPENEIERQKEELKRRETNPFQSFFLNDILMFAASQKYVSKSFKKNIDALKEIRNWVAHNKDITHKIDHTEHPLEHPLYNIEGLKAFVHNSAKFFACYEELEILIANSDS